MFPKHHALYNRHRREAWKKLSKKDKEEKSQHGWIKGNFFILYACFPIFQLNTLLINLGIFKLGLKKKGNVDRKGKRKQQNNNKKGNVLF